MAAPRSLLWDRVKDKREQLKDAVSFFQKILEATLRKQQLSSHLPPISQTI